MVGWRAPQRGHGAGEFALWLKLGEAVTLAGQLLDIAENREVLGERYAERAGNGLPDALRAANAAGDGYHTYGINR